MPAHQDAGMFGMYKVLPSTNTVESEDDTAGADDDDADDDDVNEEKGSSDNENADDAGIDEELESSATTATNENTPTILLFFSLVLSFSFYFL